MARETLLVIVLLRDWTIKLRRTIHQGRRQHGEILGHDANHRVRPAADIDLLAHDTAVTGEPLLPKTVAQNNFVVLAVDLFLWKKHAAEQRLCPHQRKIPITDQHAGNASGIATADERRAPAPERNNVFKYVVLRAIVVDIGKRTLITRVAIAADAPQKR